MGAQVQVRIRVRVDWTRGAYSRGGVFCGIALHNRAHAPDRAGAIGVLNTIGSELG